MQIRNSVARYGAIAQFLHWTMAVLIIAMVAIGMYMEDLSIPEKMPGTTGFALYQLHKSFGFIILALAILRVIWRLVSPPPPLPNDHGVLIRLGAHAGHLLLYGLIFAMPISGWLFVSADSLSHSLVPTKFFDMFIIPNLLSADDAMRDFFRGAHDLLSTLLIIVVAVHVAAALFHHFIFRDNILRRMVPFARLRPGNDVDD